MGTQVVTPGPALGPAGHWFPPSMTTKYGKSSFFKDENIASDISMHSQNLEFQSKDIHEVRMIPTKGSTLIEPAWSRCGFHISDETKSAYESSSDLETRRKAGLGISMRFPATRSALWDTEPVGLPTHITHALCIPSIFLPPDLIVSIHDSFAEKNWTGIGSLLAD